MADPDYVLQQAFDQYKESTKELIEEMKKREDQYFTLIFQKLESIREGQITAEENVKALTSRLDEAIDEDDFNNLFDKRKDDQGILNKDQLDLKLINSFNSELKDGEGNPKYVTNNEKYENLMRIHWLGSSFAKWVFFIASGILTLFALFGALTG